LIVRIISGKISDKVGRLIVLKWGIFGLFIAMLVIAFATTSEMLLFGAVTFGVSGGINSPTLFAWVVDLSPKQSVGKGLSTLFIFLEIGIIFGAFVSGALYGNQIQNFPLVFLVGAAMVFLAFLYLQFGKFKKINT